MEIDETNRFVVMEYHNDNSDGDTDALDVSGVKLYFADSRPILAGQLVVGDPGVSLFGRKVKNDFEYVSTCPSNCLATWKEEINVFVSFAHMHTMGRKIYTNQFDRDGKFVETINSVSISMHLLLHALLISLSFGMCADDSMMLPFVFGWNRSNIGVMIINR